MLRTREYSELCAWLADLSDTEVLAVLSGAEHLTVGIGGSTARVHGRGTDIFVKQLPLTAIELEDPTSTANRFDDMTRTQRYPVCCTGC
ncbi:hypothetical protein GCM10011492_24010 [Flexivirga endophytica]|uniref:Uncharacterized protein n=1 Tax=Flexivirga endophytica TaxID=1849103 RepID=A0A916WV51_9MICO|nr:hypothetical protein GCM10011492_24010 [Flexivirga endophytica]GHB53403.1 hypothetical protein GCM10008112_23290 [Flexivirga endophytica]